MPRNYKKNVIVGDLYHTNKISSKFDIFHQAKEDFPLRSTLFKEQKDINFHVPYCKRNEEKMKQIIRTLEK